MHLRKKRKVNDFVIRPIIGNLEALRVLFVVHWFIDGLKKALTIGIVYHIEPIQKLELYLMLTLLNMSRR